MTDDMSDILDEIKTKGYWKISFRPTSFPDEKMELSKLREIIDECQVRQRGWYFPVIDRRNGRTYFGDDYLTSNVKWNEFVEVWRFYQSGQFKAFKSINEDRIKYPPYSEGKNLEVIMTLYTITEFFIFAKNLVSKKIMGDSIDIKIEIFGTEERVLIMGEPMRHLHDSYSCTIDKITVFDDTVTFAKILADYDKIALDSTMSVFNKFGWINPDMKNVLKNDQEKILRGFF